MGFDTDPDTFMDIGIVNYICGNNWGTIQSFVESELINEGGLRNSSSGSIFYL